MAADVAREEFSWGKERVIVGDAPGQPPPEACELDGETIADELGLTYRSFRECVVESLAQFKKVEEEEERREKEGRGFGLEVKGAGM